MVVRRDYLSRQQLRERRLHAFVHHLRDSEAEKELLYDAGSKAGSLFLPSIMPTCTGFLISIIYFKL